MSDSTLTAQDFIREAIADDLDKGRFNGRFQTRSRPEPNGYLHIGHPKAIGLNFEVAKEFGCHCNLRFDDTNPLNKKSRSYVEAQLKDIRWLGYEPESVLYASDYFDNSTSGPSNSSRMGTLRDDLSQEEIRTLSRDPHRTGQEQPLSRPIGRGKS